MQLKKTGIAIAGLTSMAIAASDKCNVVTIQTYLPYGNVLTADYVKNNGTYGQPSQYGDDIAFPNNATGLPDLCAVYVNASSSDTSSFRFGLFMPDDWQENRFLATGLGGAAGGVDWETMGYGVKNYGCATISSDTGHNSTMSDASWAFNDEEARQDWGHRALHLSTELAKNIVNHYYDQTISHSYYAGCSTGGRQGLRALEMYPEDYDGVLAGAPAWYTQRLQTSEVLLGIYNLPENATHHIPSDQFEWIFEQVLSQCDIADGILDGIVSSPETCDFMPEKLLCGPSSNTSECLNPEQIETLNKIHSDWKSGMNDFIFPGFNLGSESTWMLTQEADDGSYEPAGFSVNYVQDFVRNDKSWDWTTFSLDDTYLAEKLRPGNATADDFDLRPFKQNGGKLIHYHGKADGSIPTGSSSYFYKQVQRNLVPKGVTIDDFYRYFEIPGMNHCMGTPMNAPWFINGVNQAQQLSSMPKFDAESDAFTAVIEWVENNRTVDYILATKYVSDDPAQGVEIQRPLCPYPVKAKYSGSGDVNSADSWTCDN
ncbi:hypothetical protein E3Q23_02037 [Wallemia mellicola]|nr:hypothetical protein E3Q23_02037 [Wallemia mellicola]